MNAIISKLRKLGVELKLVDNKLKASAPNGVLTRELLEEIKQHKDSLISYINGIAGKEDIDYPVPVADKDSYALSSAARRLYFLYEMDRLSLSYNMLQVIRLQGQLDRARITQSLNSLLERHEGLRTYFEIADGVPVQKIAQNITLNIAICDNVEQFRKPFDLSKAPLIRVGLTQISAEEHLLMIDMHHIITDGVSQEILINDFMQLYVGQELAPLKLQYKDYSEWQQRRMQSVDMINHQAFWKTVFATPPPVLELPVDFPRPPVRSTEGAICSFELDTATTAALRQLAAGNEVTMFMMLLALYNILLGALSSQDDIVVGTPVTGRTHPELENIIGMFVNMLPIRNYPSGKMPFSAFLTTVKQRVLGCLDHEEYQYEQMIDDLKIVRNLQRNPLFDVVFTYESADAAVLEMPGLQLSSYDTGKVVSKFDLTLSVNESVDHIRLSIEYNAQLFQQSTIQEFAGYFKQIVSSVIADPNRTISSIRLLTAAQEHQLLQSLDFSEVAFPVSETVHSLFEKQVALHGDRTALIFGDRTMSYSELNEASECLAAYLRNAGVQPGVIVGLLVDRGMETVIGMLGILKAGGAYLPVDVTYPESRKSYMVEDSGTPLLLSTKDVTDAASYGVPVYYIEDGIAYDGSLDRTTGSGPADLCYIIYTSGTTGNPKGVMVGHSHVVRLLFNEAFQFDFNESDVWTMFHSHCFDFSVWEMYGALLYGGRLVIIPRIVARDPLAYLEVLEKEGVTVLNQTPWSFYQLSSGPRKDFRLRYVIFGGEALVPSKLRQFHETYPQVKLINMFGITETTVHVTYKELTTADLDQDLSNIGKPIPTLSLYILDEQMRPVPRGVLGELYVGGAGVAQGYLNKAELTSRRFIDNPYGAGLLYRSGDQGRQLASGDVEYLGRIDSQVKIRGFRIELGEIESHLSGYAGISSSVVHPYEESGEKSLVAYYVTSSELDHGSLRQYLSSKLPEHMVPSYFMRLSSLPLTGNGKIDRRSLPAPVVGEEDSFVPAGDELESRLVAIWSEVLKVEEERISVTRSFFELGGHSLKVTILSNKIQQALSVPVSVKEIFTNQDIRSLASIIRSRIPEQHIPIDPALPAIAYPLSSTQRRLYFLYELNRQSLAYNMLQVTRLYGRLDIPYLTACFHKLIMRHESLRTAIVPVGDSVMQQVANSVDFTISIYEGTEDSARQIIEEFHHPFDIGKSPLIRVGLVKISKEEHLLLMDMHHIITDGLSQIILIREFMQIYAGETLPALRIGYKDYAVWQESERQLAVRGNNRAYWLDVFSGEVPVLTLPFDYKRPQILGDKGDTVQFALTREEVSALKRIAAESQSTLFMVMLSLYNILLSRLSNQDDIIIGTPVSGRYHADLEGLVGMFVNTIALRNTVTGDATFKDFLLHIRENTLKHFEHQSYPFELLVDDLSLDRDTSRNPLFDVMFAYDNPDDTVLEIPGLRLQPYLHKEHFAKFDLTHTVSESVDDLHLSFTYSTELFDKSTIDRFVVYYKNIVRTIVNDPAILLSDIRILSEEEHLALYKGVIEAPVEDVSVITLFNRCVVAAPTSIALEYRDKEITYQELDRLSDQFATQLNMSGIGVGDLVGIMLDREPFLIAAILGVLKAGAAYVPVDIDYPMNRVITIFEEAGVKTVISRSRFINVWEQGGLINVDNYVHDAPGEKLTSLPDSDGLAYVIYTSGSTGVPKGVMINHRSLLNYLTWALRRYSGSTADVYSLHTSIAFDLTVTSLFMPLISGNRLVLYDNEDSGAMLLEQVIKANRSTILKMTPSHLKILAEIPVGDSNVLHTLIVGGEQLESRVAAAIHVRFGGRVKIYNEYGPTEATVGCMCYQYNPNDDSVNVPIGYPIDNMRIHLLDRYMHPVPVGVEGEIYISGVGLANGYYKQEELTSSAFISSPLHGYGRMYRSNDVAVYHPEYGLIYHGRRDSQLKLRGNRIEPEDIVTQLCQHEHISEAAILVKEVETDPLLVCYYLAITPLEAHGIKTFLRHRLPEYMIPSFFVHLTSLPLTVNGKLDTIALPGYRIEELAVRQLPVSQLQRELAGIWSDVLGVDIGQIGVNMNFFDLGGNSIRLVRMVNRINTHFQVQLPVASVFRFPVIAAIAEHLQGHDTSQESDEDDGIQHMQETLDILNQIG
ncbi:non-ribosomal peptide synthetase [Chitinophaga rhizophila]|uniref:Amino acid adenylation domain-containing protein n=1 Tax=Chitinophaga rhizophila TaxID=2866212 RepID=A0ABS7GHN7_9BACT|nr:non-ribosomal peptide synthetase [Chitinophaga rhizophila]MBW8687218.1 amino acid adenylation domain-containing protein [Chitinophaga rhizophila]